MDLYHFDQIKIGKTFLLQKKVKKYPFVPSVNIGDSTIKDDFDRLNELYENQKCKRAFIFFVIKMKYMTSLLKI
ncbi:MAG: hypothetical protein QXO21_05440 [Candidatus Anstonellales archaeon]